MAPPKELRLTGWIDIPGTCPRCTRPLKCRCTHNWSRITEFSCTGCGWKWDIEVLRVAAKAQETTPVDPDPDATEQP